MADKEATVYIIDQGESMGKKHNGRDQSDLDYSLRYIWDKITTTMEANRKTWTLGILGLRTNSTKHPYDLNDDGYKHISIQQNLGPFYMNDLRQAQQKIGVSGTETGDAISAIVIATMMINEFTRKLKYKRKIVLVTNGRGVIDSDDIDAIASKLNEDHIELVVLGVDFDDPEYGFKEEDKPSTKAKGELLLKTLCDKCGDNGAFANIAVAIEELSTPRLKQKRPYAPYKGPLCLGDPEKFGKDRTMKIHVERYFKTKKSAPPSASDFVKRSAGDDEDTEMGGVPATDNFVAVKRSLQYKINDETAAGGKRAVERDVLASGYSYGRTAVPISDSEKTVTKLETKADFSIVGFVPQESYKKFMTMSESCITIATQTSDQDRMAMSSLVRAMAENESYAIARFVQKDLKDPKLLLLAPYIERDAEGLFEAPIEGLIDVELPFQEDIRSYRFPPLDHVVTLSGEILSTHRNLPTDDLIQSMDAYVDSMDLSKAELDEEGNPTEYLTIEENYRPDLHRLVQGIKHRASYPDSPIPPCPPILKKFEKPPEDRIFWVSQASLDELIEVADVKEVPQKAKEKGSKPSKKPQSGLDIDALLRSRNGSDTNSEIQTIRPTYSECLIDFKQFLHLDNTDHIKPYAVQFGNIIKDLITSSVGEDKWNIVLECMRVMREELEAVEEPDAYNQFLRGLKEDLKGGDHRAILWKIRECELGLIVGGGEGVTEEEAEGFWDFGGRREVVDRTKTQDWEF